MAVLHYPLDPYAYWSFDRHETLFEDKEKSRYQPSPAWNREISAESLVHYWKMDENSSNQQIQDHGFGGVDLLSSSDFSAGDFSQWGLLGNATLVSGTLSATLSVDENFTLSLWIRQPNANLTPLEVGDVTLTYDFGFDKYTFGGDMDLSPKVENYWTHIAIKCTEKKGDLYVDGRIKQANKDITNPLTILEINSPAVVDEIKVYNVSLSHRRIKYLAGRNFLDLSGNKLHLISSSTGTGKEWELEEPGTNLSSNDTPSEPNPSGSGKLGDSFAGEENGHSINFEDAQDELYLSLRHHKSAFSSIAEGTITLWVKTTQPNVPLFSMSVPYVAAPVEENSSTFEVVSPGSRFAIELVDGKPQFFGFRANQEINDGEWHHLAMSFPLGNLWIDGIPTGASPAISTGFDYEVVNTLSAIQEPEILAIGRLIQLTLRQRFLLLQA